MHRLSRTPGIPKELPPSTLSDILTGKRERPPDWQLVASFVLVCHAHAQLTGLPADALGTVEQWQARWRAARTRLQTTESYDPYRTPADEAERRTTRTIARLVRLAGDGDAESAYRLAIIHLLTGDSAAARVWIHAASRQGHPDAKTFAGSARPIEFAANQSFTYGRAYEQEGPAKRDIARFYYRLAADHRHPHAMQRLRALRATGRGPETG